jgi:hypothetical protein
LDYLPENTEAFVETMLSVEFAVEIEWVYASFVFKRSLANGDLNTMQFSFACVFYNWRHSNTVK